MKIAVCVKSVPDTEAKISILADQLTFDHAGIKFITSPFDEYAIEAALQLKERYGGEITAFSLGGEEVVEVLRNTLARGVDNGVHIKDPEFAGADPLTAAKILAAAIDGGDFQLILCGQQGVGGDNSQVPAMLAELLDLPQATLVVALEIEADKFKAHCEIEGAHQIVQGTLPAVISTGKGLNEPRYPSIKGVMAARRKEIVIKDAAALGLSGQLTASQRKVKLIALNAPPARPSGKMIAGDPATQAHQLARLLREEAKVL